MEVLFYHLFHSPGFSLSLTCLGCGRCPLEGQSSLGSIFINYRRQDSEGEAGRLFDDLSAKFGPDSVFMDVAGISAGRDFRKAIDENVSKCAVLLALIGHSWLDAQNSQGGRRLDDPNDFVRMELASALSRDIPVVPILVRGAVMPPAGSLPDDLKELVYRNAMEITHVRWKSDVGVLIRALSIYVQPCAPAVSPATPAMPEQAGAEFDAATLERVAKELAQYIGPIASVVVKRAARRSGSLRQLAGLVAEEIESEHDRASFLRAVKA